MNGTCIKPEEESPWVSSYYTIHGDQFAYIRGEVVIAKTDGVAICYSIIEGDGLNIKHLTTVHRHGSIKHVKKFYKTVLSETHNVYQNQEKVDDILGRWEILWSDDWDLGDLNKIVGVTGYLTSWLKTHGLL